MDFVHEHKIPFLIPWAAAAPVVSLDRNPSYVFRLSVRDEFAGEFLVQEAVKTSTKIALFLEKTAWGRSNKDSMRRALDKRGLSPIAIHWFNWGDRSFNEKIRGIRERGTEAILLVANPPEGEAILAAVAQEAPEIRIVSHWGITAGDFGRNNREILSRIDLSFLQTQIGTPDLRQKAYAEFESFVGSPPQRAIEIAPVGFSNAHDLMLILIRALEAADSLDRPDIRRALEHLGPVSGLVKNYERPFRPDWHEALGPEDFVLCGFDDQGHVVLKQ